MAQHCTVCTSELRPLIDSELLNGVRVATLIENHEISASGVSLSALYRHKNRHLASSLLRESRADSTTSTIDLLERLAEVVADVSAVRAHALATGSTGLLLRASEQTLKAANALYARLGGDGDTETVRLLRESETLARGVVGAVRADPTIGGAIARSLDALGTESGTELATTVRNASITAALAAKTKKDHENAY